MARYLKSHWKALIRTQVLLTVMSTSSSPIQSSENFHKNIHDYCGWPFLIKITDHTSLFLMAEYSSLRKHITHRPSLKKAFQKFLACRHSNVGLVNHVTLRSYNFLYSGTYIKQLWFSISINFLTLNNTIMITISLSYHIVNT